MHLPYANIVLKAADQAQVVRTLNELGAVAYVAPTQRGATAVFHEDLSGQEHLAAALSARLNCTALLAMTLGTMVLLYQLYVNGDLIDTYVSEPHDELELDSLTEVAGDAAKLCSAFDADRKLRSVDRILRKEATPTNDYSYAINRHGELLRALDLPLCAAGASFSGIETGEAVHPEGPTAVLAQCVRTGG